MKHTEIISEIDIFRKRLKAVRDHYGDSEHAKTWIEVEDKAREAFDALSSAKKALKVYAKSIGGLDETLMKMVFSEREHNEHCKKHGQPEVTVCHNLLESWSTSDFKKQFQADQK